MLVYCFNRFIGAFRYGMDIQKASESATLTNSSDEVHSLWIKEAQFFLYFILNTLSMLWETE